MKETRRFIKLILAVKSQAFHIDNQRRVVKHVLLLRFVEQIYLFVGMIEREGASILNSSIVCSSFVLYELTFNY